MSDIQAVPTGLPPVQAAAKIDVAEVARTSWRVFRRQPWRYVWLLLIPVLVTIPFTLLQAFIGRGREAAVGVGIVAILSAVIQYATQFTCQLAGIYGASRNMEGASFTTGEALRAGFGRLLPYLGLIILAAIIVLVGFLLFVIPALIAGIFLAPAGAACLIERRGPIGSIQRSVDLVRGNWWRSFGALLLAVLVPFLVVFAAGVVFYLICAALGVKALSLILILPAVPAFLCIGAVATIIPAVLFIQLRAAKEGLHAGGVAGIFD